MNEIRSIAVKSESDKKDRGFKPQKMLTISCSRLQRLNFMLAGIIIYEIIITQTIKTNDFL